MLRGLARLTWLEIKIFVREPLGVIGTIGIPVLAFLVVGRLLGRRAAAGSPEQRALAAVDVPVFAAVLIALSAVLSLVTIVSIYRESGILKRLRATPLRSHTILAAHVCVKLCLTAVTLILMGLTALRYYPIELDVRIFPFTLALLFSTLSIVSIGFIIASLVPTARFAQPIGSLVLYPMLAVSGLFIPLDAQPPIVQAIARFLPLTYAVSLLKGIWQGDPLGAHLGDVAALLAVFVICTAVSVKVFRWE